MSSDQRPVAWRKCEEHMSFLAALWLADNSFTNLTECVWLEEMDGLMSE